MNYPVRRWRTTMRVLAVALIVATVPWPALAGEGKQPATKPGLQASIRPAVHAVVIAAKPASRQSAQEQAPVDKSVLESKSFFKTTTGLIVLAVVGAGVGVTFYSISHDRIQATGR